MFMCNTARVFSSLYELPLSCSPAHRRTVCTLRYANVLYAASGRIIVLEFRFCLPFFSHDGVMGNCVGYGWIWVIIVLEFRFFFFLHDGVMWNCVGYGWLV